MKLTYHTFKTKPTVQLPVITFKGKESGPTAFISGGIHGNELNGIALVKHFLDDFIATGKQKTMKGKLIVLPILNPTGFLNLERRAEPDNLDLNRAFPGNPKGPFSQQFAHELMEQFISKVDFGIDCHDAGENSALLPHTRVLDCSTDATEEICQMGRLFGAQVMVQRKGKPGMLALEAFNKYKVPILTVEMGGAQHQDDEFIKKGIAGIYNTLRFYKMVPGKVKKNKEPFLLKRRFGLRSPETAVIKFKVNLGDFVHAGDEFGTLYYPQHYSEEPFFSPLCGLVFSLHDRQIIKKNKRICSILEQENCHIMKKTLKTNEIKM